MNPFGNLVEPVFVISRNFDAPKEKIWRAFNNSESMKGWWGKPGYEAVVSNMDFRPGGAYHYCLYSQEGFEIWGKFSYRQIEIFKNIVLIHYFSDRFGNLCRHPLMPFWPLQILSTFTFNQEKDKTALTIQATPLSPKEEERKTFQESTDKINQAWDQTLEHLAKFLREVR